MHGQRTLRVIYTRSLRAVQYNTAFVWTCSKAGWCMCVQSLICSSDLGVNIEFYKLANIRTNSSNLNHACVEITCRRNLNHLMCIGVRSWFFSATNRRRMLQMFRWPVVIFLQLSRRQHNQARIPTQDYLHWHDMLKCYESHSSAQLFEFRQHNRTNIK